MSTQVILQPLLLALKGNPWIKYEKKPNDIDCFFTFFTTLDIIWPKFYPKTTRSLTFFSLFPIKYVRDSISIKNFNWNPVVQKILLKLEKITIFWLSLCKTGVPMGHAQNKKQFFSKITKPDPKFSKHFYFKACVHYFFINFLFFH